MSPRALLGRVLISVAAALAAAVPLAVDLTGTHVLNPAWPAHARLHEVWLLASGAFIALVTLYFAWIHRERRFGVMLSGVLLTCLLGGFFVASATAPLYGGILVDPVTAPMMLNGDMMLGMPANSFAFGVALLLLWIGVALARVDGIARVSAAGSS